MLIGDACDDIYHYGQINRISPEAPVPIFDELRTETKQGMTHNVLKNMQNLGLNPNSMTKLCDEKHRYIDEKSMQQVMRVDIRVGSDSDIPNIAVAGIDFKNYDIVVISDYNKGFISYEMIESIRDMCECPIFVDTKKTNLSRLEGCILKINDNEYSKLISECSNMIVTYGGKKVVWNDEVYYPPKVNVHDVCGAGDTFLAALCYGYTIYQCIPDAIEFAMKAAAESVKHFGVYAPTLKEIEDGSASI